MEKKLSKLTLNQETVRNLTANEVDHVQGGFAIGTRTCAVGCNSQQTCQASVCFGTCPV
jgi:natural product precursor